MKKLVPPGARAGCVTPPASKSQAHRILICAALSEGETRVVCDGVSKDIEATVRCLSALGADIKETEKGVFAVRPIRPTGKSALLPCGESGSTLRFLLPLVGALGAEATFLMEGKLPERPLEPLIGELRAHGMSIRREGDRLFCAGRLQSGGYTLPGDISSQFISGLLFALPLLPGDSALTVTGRTESADYIAMTEDVIHQSGVRLNKTESGYRIPGGQTFRLPERVEAEKDWSSAAFFLAMGAFSSRGVTARGLRLLSKQGDKRMLDILASFGAEVEAAENEILVRKGRLTGTTVDASQVPDLVPVVSAVAAAAEGETRIVNAGRLRLKESDRLQTTAAMLRSLGADAEETEDGLVIRGRYPLKGGKTASYGDHRIAMAAATAAAVCETAVEIDGAECADKSYPRFWDDLEDLEVL